MLGGGQTTASDGSVTHEGVTLPDHTTRSRPEMFGKLALPEEVLPGKDARAKTAMEA